VNATTGANQWANRIGIYHRPDQRAPWVLIGHAGARAAAAWLVRLMGAGRGDWRTGPVGEPARRPAR
jgi:hypothetical protein